MPLREKSLSQLRNRLALTMFPSGIRILHFDDVAATTYGKIRATLEKKSTPIGPLDTQIAAHAMLQGMTLVTNNTREFTRVDGLDVEDWAKCK